MIPGADANLASAVAALAREVRELALAIREVLGSEAVDEPADGD